MKNQPNLNNISQYPKYKADLFFSDNEPYLQRLLLVCGDVEQNPGPQGHNQPDLRTISYNIRGLGDERKLRHLLNIMHQKKGGKNSDFIACMQETYIVAPGKIPYIWRGNFFLTPGNGHSCGCLTLLSPHLNVISSKHFGHRGHVVACQRTGENNVTYVIANIYAPNPNTNEKIEFFEEVFDAVQEFQERYNCSAALILGDYNLVLKERETKLRNYSAQEKRVAKVVIDLLETSGMADIWNNFNGFTWRRPGTDSFSTIDRIAYSKDSLMPVSVKDDWTLSFSDHAAVEASFKDKKSKKSVRSRITRLDPHLAKVEWTRNKIETDFNEMYSTTPDVWDPHMKLEFAKLCIRTVNEQVQAERKQKETSEEESINEELEVAINRLSEGVNEATRTGDLIDYVETLRARKALLIEEKGERLAEKLGSKWYNEGEKSTRYFLRLLNRSLPDDFKLIPTD